MSKFIKAFSSLGILFVFATQSVAQLRLPVADTLKTQKGIYLEYMGAGLFLTANFDMRLNKMRNDGWGLRAGMGIGTPYSTRNNISRYISTPVGINYLLGKKSHHLELGVGTTAELAISKTYEDPAAVLLGFLNAGYRYQSIKNRLTFRATWTPIFDTKDIYLGWAGISVGYNLSHANQERKPKVMKTAVNNGKVRKSVYVEALGAGVGLSANYDMRFKPDRNDGLGYRVGAGILASDTSIPVGINYIVGKGRSGFETGLGATFLLPKDSFDPNRKNQTVGFLTLGYRYQPIKNGLLLRVSLDPYWVNKKLSSKFAGLSLGYSFK